MPKVAATVRLCGNCRQPGHDKRQCPVLGRGPVNPNVMPKVLATGPTPTQAELAPQPPPPPGTPPTVQRNFPAAFNAAAWSYVFKAAKRERKPRQELPREDYATAPWQLMVDSGSYRQVETRQGKSFRKKFRVPFPVFDYIVAQALHWKWFPEYNSQGSGKDAVGREIPSLQVKILCVLRVLGSGCEFAGCYDGSRVDEQTVRKFFYRFLTVFASQMYKIWVHPPSTDHELQQTLQICAR